MFEENDNIFPVKPELSTDASRSKLIRFLISFVLFVAAFFILFSDSYVFITELLIVLIIHEMGHLAAMKLYGYKSLNMVFIPLIGAMVSGEKFKVSQKQKVMVSLMGPLPGIVIGCTMFYAAANNPEPNIYFTEVALLLIIINILNLIPIDPLDGGKVFETLFFPSNDTVKMYFTLISSVLIIGIGWYTDFWVIMAFGFIMAFKVRSYQKNKVIHEELDELEFDYKKEYKDLSDREYWMIRKVFLNNNPKIKDVIPSGYMLWENEKLLVDQINQLLKIQIKKDLSLGQIIFFLLITVSAIALPIYLLSLYPDLLDWYWNNVTAQAGR